MWWRDAAFGKGKEKEVGNFLYRSFSGHIQTKRNPIVGIVASMEMEVWGSQTSLLVKAQRRDRSASHHDQDTKMVVVQTKFPTKDSNRGEKGFLFFFFFFLFSFATTERWWATLQSLCDIFGIFYPKISLA